MNLRFVPLMLFIVMAGCSRPEQISSDDGEPVKIDPAKPPNGMHLVQILLANQSLPVKGTRCEGSWSSDDKRRLQHKLAMALGDGLDNPRHRTELLGGCETDQFELRSGSTVDGWRCNLNVVEKDKKGEFIANSSIYFGIKKDTWEFIPEALVCL